MSWIKEKFPRVQSGTIIALVEFFREERNAANRLRKLENAEMIQEAFIPNQGGNTNRVRVIFRVHTTLANGVLRTFYNLSADCDGNLNKEDFMNCLEDKMFATVGQDYKIQAWQIQLDSVVNI